MSKNTHSFGATFPIRKRLELEGYYERENTAGGDPPHVNGIGMTYPSTYAGARFSGAP